MLFYVAMAWFLGSCWWCSNMLQFSCVKNWSALIMKVQDFRNLAKNYIHLKKSSLKVCCFYFKLKSFPIKTEFVFVVVVFFLNYFYCENTLMTVACYVCLVSILSHVRLSFWGAQILSHLVSAAGENNFCLAFFHMPQALSRQNWKPNGGKDRKGFLARDCGSKILWR